MNEAREVFEALMLSKGIKAEWNGTKYTTVNVQTYWRWFLMGWTLKGTK